MQRVLSVFGLQYDVFFKALLIKRLLARAAGALAVSELLAYALLLPPLWRSLLGDVVGLLLFAFMLPPLFKPALAALGRLEAGNPNSNISNINSNVSDHIRLGSVASDNTNSPNDVEAAQQNELTRLAQYAQQLVEQLEQAQQRFDRLFHNLYDGAIRFDKNGVCVAVNEPHYFDFAFPLHALRGKTIRSYYGDLGTRHEYYRQRALEQNEAQVYRHDLTLDGTPYYREYRTFPLAADGDNAETIILVRDISKEHNVTQQLRASEKRFRTFFEKSPLPCLLLDMQASSDHTPHTDGAGIRFHVLVNDAFEAFLGYNPWGDSYYDYATAFACYQSYSYPEDFAQEVSYIDDIVQGRRQDYQLEKRFYAADGSLRWGDVRSNVITRYDGSLSLLMFTVRDITKQKRTQRQLQTSLLQLQQSETRFRAFFEQNASPCTIPTLLADTAADGDNTEPSQTLLYIMANDAFVAFLGDNPWAHGTHTDEEALAINHRRTHPDDIALEKQYIQETRDGQRDNYRLQKRFLHQDGSVRWGDVQTVVLHDDAGDFSMALTTVQDITATKLAQRDLKDALSQLEQAYEDAMRVVGLMLEYRDYETKGHTDRVTQLSLKLADALALPASERYALKRGAYLHDIGKIAIPDAILHKPGKLTDNEWLLMQAHTTIGDDFVKQLSFLPQGSKDVVRSHHEKYAGGGYPDGLSGQDIPLLARIFALADVYDALTSQRCYKDAWPHERALTEIHNQAGQHFDPDLVAVFLTLFETTPHANAL
jgi:HD-GYP domain-containing protein (c-di-GMP phosphodiesterase class II)